MILAVRHLRLENFILAGGIECLLTELVPVVHAGSRIVSPAFIIVSHVRLCPQFTLDLAQMELVLRVLLVVSVRVGIIRSRADLIKTTTRVCSRCHLSRRYTRRNITRDHCILFVLGRLVLQQRLIDVFQLAPVRRLVVSTRLRVFKISRTLDEARAWCRWTKSRNLH